MPLWNTPGTKIACVKGFVHGVDWDLPVNKRAREDLINKLKNYDTICWDGDLWNPKSMTDVIKEAMDIFDNKYFVVTIKEKDIVKLIPTFKKIDRYGTELKGYPKGGSIYPVALSDDMKWDQLGIEGMKIMTQEGAKVDVFYLGAGPVALKEKEYLEQNMGDKVTTKEFYRVIRQ